jgi:hypothetical protein
MTTIRRKINKRNEGLVGRLIADVKTAIDELEMKGRKSILLNSNSLGLNGCRSAGEKY